MSFLNGGLVYASLPVDTFTGDGSTVAYTLTTRPGTTSGVSVYINGVRQAVSTYSVNGLTLTFVTAPPTNAEIEVIFRGKEVDNVTSVQNQTSQVFNGDGTTNQAFTLSTDPGSKSNTQLFINGIYQLKASYTVSGTTLTLTGSAPVGTGNVEVVYGNAASIGTPSDGTVGTLQLADLGVSTAKIAANAVTTAKVADNAITGPKIAMGSDAAGDVLYYNGTDYTRLGIGTANQVLQTNSGATAPEWTDPAGGAQTRLATLTASASATLDFDTVFSDNTGYDHYLVFFDDFVAATSNSYLYMTVTDDSGSTFESSNYEYGGSNAHVGNTTGGYTFTSGTSTSQIHLTPNTDGDSRPGNSAAAPLNGRIFIYNPRDAAKETQVNGQLCYGNTNGNTAECLPKGAYVTTAALTGFRIAMGSGNITSGSVHVYGWSTS